MPYKRLIEKLRTKGRDFLHGQSGQNTPVIADAPISEPVMSGPSSAAVRHALEGAGFYTLTSISDEISSQWEGMLYLLMIDTVASTPTHTEFVLFIIPHTSAETTPTGPFEPQFRGTATEMLKHLRLSLLRGNVTGTTPPKALPKKGGMGARLKPVAHHEVEAPKLDTDPAEIRRKNFKLFFDLATAELERRQGNR